MAKMKIRIDTEDRTHDVTHENGKYKKLTEDEYKQVVAAAGDANTEEGKFYFTKNSPGCVTFFFRGIPYQV